MDDEDRGEAAFTWLRGESVSDSTKLGVAKSLFELAPTGQRSSADATAIDALESLAALFRLAERPLVIMVDQAEVFSRSEYKPSEDGDNFFVDQEVLWNS